MLLPKVEVYEVKTEAITNQFNASGIVKHSNRVEIKSAGDMKINDVLVKQGQQIKAGDPILLVDTEKSSGELKKLELALTQKKNMLTPATLSPEKKAEIELQLKIARNELDLFKMNHELERELNGQRHEATIREYAEKSAEAAQLLNNAIAQLQEFDGSSAALEQQLRLALLQATHQLLISDANSENKTAAQLNYENKLAEYQQYALNYEVEGVINEEQLNLKILQYESMLTPEQLTKAQKAEIQLQIDIAKSDLESFKKMSPPDGNVRSEVSGIIQNVAVKKGDTIASNSSIVSILTEESKPMVEWTTSYGVGSIFDKGDIVEIAANSQDGMAEPQRVPITDKMQNENNEFVFTAEIAELTDGTASITMSTTSKSYSTIVPLSALYTNTEGESCVYIINKGNGFFSAETFVTEESVKVISKNNTHAAIESLTVHSKSPVLMYTNKPISNGSIVSVINGM